MLFQEPNTARRETPGRRPGETVPCRDDVFAATDDAFAATNDAFAATNDAFAATDDVFAATDDFFARRYLRRGDFLAFLPQFEDPTV